MLFSAELPIGYNYISIPNCLRRTQQGYTETHLLPSHCVPQSHHYILVCCVLKRVVKHTITNFHNSLALLLCHSIAMVKYHSTQLSFLSPHKDHKRNVIEMQRFVHYTFKIFKVKWPYIIARKLLLYFQLYLQFSVVGTSNLLFFSSQTWLLKNSI